MLMHRFPDSGPFQRRMQVADLDYVASSVAAQTTIAEIMLACRFRCNRLPDPTMFRSGNSRLKPNQTQ